MIHSSANKLLGRRLTIGTAELPAWSVSLTFGTMVGNTGKKAQEFAQVAMPNTRRLLSTALRLMKHSNRPKNATQRMEVLPSIPTWDEWQGLVVPYPHQSAAQTLPNNDQQSFFRSTKT
ncbi:MAG: hypothetical protein M2R45_05189 [Verrucomicrobia subdivision 3 bacterium]|nr:hypothetical protein [Limisphaerales bacterium]MCS1417586.1 hypothetical protein [Limisphaerales bacterium]